jgi:phosphate transport system permease protein
MRLYRMLRVALAAVAWVFLGSYGVGLAYLLVRGGFKVFAFTLHPTPLSGVAGETAVRVGVGFVIFGSAQLALMAFAATTIRSFTHRPWHVPAWALAPIALLAGALSLTFRDHLPRFLISMPSETVTGSGIGPQLFNTLYFAVLSTALSLPVGVAAAIYLARFAGNGPFVRAMRVALDTLASLPSIVYGLFGFLLFVVTLRAGYCLFAGAFVLALLNLPLIVSVTKESLNAVPRELEEGSLALGATVVETRSGSPFPTRARESSARCCCLSVACSPRVRR